MTRQETDRNIDNIVDSNPLNLGQNKVFVIAEAACNHMCDLQLAKVMIDEAAKAGITAVIQPGGSIRDDEVIQAVDEHDMAMILTGVRHFRHA